MSFSTPTPPALVMPSAPPAISPLAPTGMRPQRKPMQPSFLGEAMTPTSQQEGARTLIGGIPTALGRA